METQVVILEYCGGSVTDDLYSGLTRWNPRRSIAVIDNASPRNRCTCITHQNSHNTYIGGGLQDCIRLAEAQGSDFLFFVANDICPQSPIDINRFECAMSDNRCVVQVGAAVTPTSDKANCYPWMVAQNGRDTRPVPHCDLLCCILRLSFIREFGGFPPSRSGWGYDWDIAYQAACRGRVVMISDLDIISHHGGDAGGVPVAGCEEDKRAEMLAVYADRYPNIRMKIAHTRRDWELGRWSTGPQQRGVV
jgi:hypothetical protein